MPKKKKPAKKVTVEKRQYLRLGYSRLISFTHYDPDSLVEIPGNMAAVHDLSQSGVLIESAVAFDPGNVIDLDMAFEQDKIILAQGEVVHCKKTGKNLYRAGIKFLRIEDEHLAYLKKFLNNQYKQEIKPKKNDSKPEKKDIKPRKKKKK
jgi:c-di-GMP-binding flagellar brake protein YcgR